MKNVIIISEAPLVWGNSAAVARMNNYAKALAANEGVRVYQFSSLYVHIDSKIVKISENSYTTEKPQRENSKSWRNVWFFLDWVDKNVRQLEGESVYFFYPSSNPLLEICFLFSHKLFRHSKAYCESNEVRKYASGMKNIPLHKQITQRLIYWLAERLYSKYDGMVCISKNIEHYFSKYQKNSIVIPILSDIATAIPEKEKIADRNERIRFVFTGTVSIEKENLEELIEGFRLYNKTYPDWELNLYGRSAKQECEKVEQFIYEKGLETKIRLKGEVLQSQIPDILSSADCLMLPRRNNLQNYYGFSTKLSEYAVSGTPIILTDTGVVADYFTDGENCLMVNGYEAKGFAEKLIRFKQLSSIERENLAKNAYLTAQKEFFWANYSKILNEFFQSNEANNA